MVDRDQILEFIRLNKAQFYRQYNIVKIGIFGSVARNEQTDKSDIDLIVEFEPGTPNLFQKKIELKKIFSDKFKVEVDICREKYIKPMFKKQIIQDTLYV